MQFVPDTQPATQSERGFRLKPTNFAQSPLTFLGEDFGASFILA